MSETQVRRRGFREDGICFDAARNRYMGAVSLGYGPDGKRIRRKVSGKTKQEVRAKLQALHKEMNAGVKSSSTCTVRQTVEDWLREGLDGTSERTRTLCEGLLGPLLDAIGARPLRVLSAGDVRSGLGKPAYRYSSRSLPITRLSLERAIRHAEAGDLVGRNVAALVKAPQGRTGRPSRSFTLEQAKALLAAAQSTRLHAYVVLSLLVGIRTEEARALRWDHVVTWVDDSAGWQPITTAGFGPARAGGDRYAIYVWRSERHGGDTKTGKSRRTQGDAAHLRLGPIRERRPRGKHRPARRTRAHGYHRVGLPPRDPPGTHPRRRSNGQDLRLANPSRSCSLAFSQTRQPFHATHDPPLL